MRLILTQILSCLSLFIIHNISIIIYLLNVNLNNKHSENITTINMHLLFLKMYFSIIRVGITVIYKKLNS